MSDCTGKVNRRIIYEITRLGEDMLRYRVKFFVFKQNYAVDVRFGRVDKISLGMPAEEVLINALVCNTLASPPFPLASRRPGLVPVHKTDPHYEPNSFDYYHSVRLDEQKQEIDRMRGEASARGPATQHSPVPASTVPLFMCTHGCYILYILYILCA